MTYFTQSIKALTVAAALALPMLAFAAEPAMEKDGMLTDHQGMTLYTFDKDAGAKSMCNAQCETNWPPLMAKEGDKSMGEWTVITRDDGKKQWAYDGKPLYTFAGDKQAGEKTGDGKGGVWHIAKPD
jgi:predicted lipoprotein with Yx(FWY)xxD motif